MALNSAGITAAIAALSITGVTVKDVDAIPESVLPRDCPILFPQPGNWLGGTQIISDAEGRTTFGAAGARFWVAERTFNYVFLSAGLGTGRGNRDLYSAATTETELILTAITAIDVNGVDLKDASHEPIGVGKDAAGKNFVGCLFHFTFRERINA